MMQDRKALQAGTSHFLGQNFAKASGIQFQGANRRSRIRLDHIMGCVDSPDRRHDHGSRRRQRHDRAAPVSHQRISPSLPIIRDESERESVESFCKSLADQLRQLTYHKRSIDVELDLRDMNAGEKSWNWIKKGIPVILEIGPRDIQNNAVFVYRRDKTRKERYGMERDAFTHRSATFWMIFREPARPCESIS